MTPPSGVTAAPGAALTRIRVDLRAMVSSEQARERRRLCTDLALYRRACEETAEEVRRYAAAMEQERKISA